MRFLDVDTCLSTKFQGGANAPLRPPPLKYPVYVYLPYAPGDPLP